MFFLYPKPGKLVGKDKTSGREGGLMAYVSTTFACTDISFNFEITDP